MDMESFIQCFRMWNALKTVCVPEHVSLKLVPIHSRVSSLFSQCHICHYCQMTQYLVSACAVYNSHVHFCCICSPVLYVPLDNMSKSLWADQWMPCEAMDSALCQYKGQNRGVKIFR